MSMVAICDVSLLRPSRSTLLTHRCSEATQAEPPRCQEVQPIVDVSHREQRPRCKVYLRFVPRRGVGIPGRFQKPEGGQKSGMTAKRVLYMSIAEEV